MNRISVKQQRMSPAGYWDTILDYARELCKTEPTVQAIFTKVQAFIDEQYSNTKARVSLFNASVGRKEKWVIAFIHGTSNGGDQIASLSENYQPHEKVLIDGKNYLLLQLRDGFNVFENDLPYNIKGWLNGEETFEQASNGIRHLVEEKMASKKKWNNQAVFNEDLESSMPALIIHNVHYNSSFIKLMKCKNQDEYGN